MLLEKFLALINWTVVESLYGANVYHKNGVSETIFSVVLLQFTDLLVNLFSSCHNILLFLSKLMQQSDLYMQIANRN